MKNDRLKSILGIPYFLFLVIFVVCPVLILLYYAFTNGQGQFTVSNLCNPARECFINVICNAYVDQLHFAYHGIKRNLNIDRRKSCISSIPKYRDRYDL